VAIFFGFWRLRKTFRGSFLSHFFNSLVTKPPKAQQKKEQKHRGRKKKHGGKVFFRVFQLLLLPGYVTPKIALKELGIYLFKSASHMLPVKLCAMRLSATPSSAARCLRLERVMRCSSPLRSVLSSASASAAHSGTSSSLRSGHFAIRS
jgi:hypothetical protein